MTRLGSLPGTAPNGGALDVSGDGSVVVGFSQSARLFMETKAEHEYVGVTKKGQKSRHACNLLTHSKWPGRYWGIRNSVYSNGAGIRRFDGVSLLYL